MWNKNDDLVYEMRTQRLLSAYSCDLSFPREQFSMRNAYKPVFMVTLELGDHPRKNQESKEMSSSLYDYICIIIQAGFNNLMHAERRFKAEIS